MQPSVSVTFSTPHSGWMELMLGSGQDELRIVMSYTPYDSLSELASALAGLLEAGRQGVARICSEPDEYDLIFEPGALPGSGRIRALHFRDTRRMLGSGQEVWVHEGDAVQMGRALWRALRNLETRLVREHWAHDFPTKVVGSLEQLTARPGLETEE